MLKGFDQDRILEILSLTQELFQRALNYFRGEGGWEKETLALYIRAREASLASSTLELAV